jgi:hypothetical protein
LRSKSIPLPNPRKLVRGGGRNTQRQACRRSATARGALRRFVVVDDVGSPGGVADSRPRNLQSGGSLLTICLPSTDLDNY